jgi:hypothetical protein
MFLHKPTLDKLEEIYRTASFVCPQNKAKYFALFAFGEAYSVRPGLSPESVPGTTYFAQALDLNQIIQERPSMMHLETLLLLVRRDFFQRSFGLLIVIVVVFILSQSASLGMRSGGKCDAPGVDHRAESQHTRLSTYRSYRKGTSDPSVVDYIHFQPHVEFQDGLTAADFRG